MKKSFFLLETQLFETDRSISLHFKTEEHLKTVLDAVPRAVAVVVAAAEQCCEALTLKTVLDAVPGAVVVVVAAAEQCCAALTLKKSFHQTLKTVAQKNSTILFFCLTNADSKTTLFHIFWAKGLKEKKIVNRHLTPSTKTNLPTAPRSYLSHPSFSHIRSLSLSHTFALSPLFLSHSRSLSLSFKRIHSHILYFFQAHTNTFFLPLKHTSTLSLSAILTFSFFHTHTHTRCLSHFLTRTHTHTLSLSPSEIQLHTKG